MEIILNLPVVYYFLTQPSNAYITNYLFPVCVAPCAYLGLCESEHSAGDRAGGVWQSGGLPGIL